MAGFFRKRQLEAEFLPAALEILESPPSPLGRVVALAIALFVALALLWAVFSEIDIVAVAQGRLVPTGHSKLVQPFEAGIVARIAVAEGDRVQAGDPLVELDPTIAGADRDKILLEIGRQELIGARLRALLGLPGGDILDDAASASAYDPAALAIERQLRRTQSDEFAAKLAALAQEAERQKAAAAGAEAEIAQLAAQIPLKREQLAARRELLAKGLTPKLLVLEVEQELLGLEGGAKTAAAHLAEAQAALAAIERQILQAREEFRRDRLKELTEAEAALRQLRADLKKAEQRRAQQILTAPVAGEVQQLRLHTIGGIVQPGEVLMVIVPEGERLEIEATIENKDIGFVAEGQEAVVKLAAFPFTRYGTLTGRVLSISADALPMTGAGDEGGSAGSGAATSGSAAAGSGSTESGALYRARIALDADHIRIEDREVKLAPGMAATIEIKTGHRRLIEFLLSPLLKMTDEAARER